MTEHHAIAKHPSEQTIDNVVDRFRLWLRLSIEHKQRTIEPNRVYPSDELIQYVISEMKFDDFLLDVLDRISDPDNPSARHE